MSLKEKIINAGAHLLGILAQEQAHHDPVKTVTPGMPELLRHAAAQGAVLLENRVLPFAPGTKVAAFGRVQVNWFCAGYGSGGDVNMPYKRGLLEGLRSCEDLQTDEALAQKYETWCAEHPIEDSVWGMWPRYYPEMPLEQAEIQEAAKRAAAYNTTVEKLSAHPLSPLNNYQHIAEAKIPIFCIRSGQDQSVIPEENIDIFAERLKAAGGNIEILDRPLYGHHPHGLDDPAPLVDFILKNYPF